MYKKNSNQPMRDVLKVFETLPQLYLILSKELTILTASNAYLRQTHKLRDEIAGKYIFDVFPIKPNWQQERDGGIAYSLNQVLQTGQPHQLPVIRFDTPDEDNPAVLSEHYWLTTHTPVLNEMGDISYIIHHTQEVSAQVLAEKELKRSLEKETRSAAHSRQLTERLERLLQEIPARIAVMTGPDLVFEFINPHFEQSFPNRRLLGRPILQALPELLAHPVMQILKHVYQTGETFTGKEMHVPLANEEGGKPVDRYFNFIYQARFDESGAVSGLMSFAYDITEIVAGRKHLEENERTLIALNNELAQTSEELQASTEEIQSANEELSVTNEQLHQAHQNLWKLNNELERKVDLRTLELRAARTEAENQRERLKSFFMQAPSGICLLTGPQFVFELVNPPYQQFFPGRQLTGKAILEALPELSENPVMEVLNNVYQTGQTFEGKELLVSMIRTDSGMLEDRYFNFIYQARRDVNGNIDGILVFAFEVTETVLTRQKEIENEQRFRFLLNAIPQQVWTARPDGTLDYVNEIVCDDFEQSQDEIVGHGWQAFIHPDDLPGCLQKWTEALKTGCEYVMEFRLRFGNGSYVWHLARAVPLIESGQIKLWLGTNTNIQIQKNNEQRKDEFLSIASHELKTPLTSIKAFNQLMQRTQDYQKLNGFIQKSATHVRRLEKLINDLLDVTRINGGKIQYNNEVFSFAALVADTVESFQHITPSHQIILHNHADADYEGDRFRLEQVLNNFLSNAVKYSPGADKIVVSTVINNHHIEVSVQDFGIGIAPKHLNYLFDRYYRVDNTAMRFEGLGLGLFISAEILKRHQGSFRIESTPGQGSTFYFVLPLQQDAAVTNPIG